MASAGTVLYYSNQDSPETWSEETFRVKQSITHSITGRAQVATFIVANPRNTRDSIYTSFRRIKVVEKNSGLTIFLGKVIASTPNWEDSLGQILKVVAKGYDLELFNRKLNSDYSGLATGSPNYEGRRSKVIENMVLDYTYPGTVSTSIEESGNTDESAAIDYSDKDSFVISEIESLALEDYWTNETWGAAWRWNGASWNDNTSEANSPAGTPFDFLADTEDYFYLGQNNPFIGATFDVGTNGNYGTQTWEYWDGSDWSELTINTGYDFTADGTIKWNLPLNWATTTLTGGTPPDSTARYYVRVSVDSVTTTATINSITCKRGCGYDYRVDTSQEFKYFRRSSIPAGGPADNGLTISIHESETANRRIMLSDYSFSEETGEIITRVTVKGHDNTGTLVEGQAVDSEAEATYETVLEKVEYVWGSNSNNANLQAYCDDRAEALLNSQAVGLLRGEVRIAKYPYYGSPATLVWAGDMIHIKCSPRGIEDDFLVLEISYEEPNGLTKMKVVSNVYGRGFSPFELSSILQNLRNGADVTIQSARINDLIVNSAQINSLEANKITTGTLAADVKITVGNSTSGIGTAFSDARVEILPTGLRGYSSSAQTFEIKNDGSGFLGAGSNKIEWTTLGAVTVPVATISNLTIAAIDSGTMENAVFLLGTGAVMKTGVSPNSRIEITNTQIVGYSDATTKEFYIDNDGKAYFGGGNVTLDADGLLLESGADIYLGSRDSGTDRVRLNEYGLYCYEGSTEIFRIDPINAEIRVSGNNKLSFYSGASLIGDIEISAFFGLRGNSTNVVGMTGNDVDIKGTNSINLTVDSTDAKLSLQPSGYSYLQSEDDYNLYLTARGTGDIVIKGTEVYLGDSTTSDMLGINSTSVVIKSTKELVLPSSTGSSYRSIWIAGTTLRYYDNNGDERYIEGTAA